MISQVARGRGSQKQDRANFCVNFSDGVRTCLIGIVTTVPQLLHRIVLPHDFALVAVERNVRRILLTLKQNKEKMPTFMELKQRTKASFFSTVSYKLKRILILS